MPYRTRDLGNACFFHEYKVALGGNKIKLLRRKSSGEEGKAKREVNGRMGEEIKLVATLFTPDIV